MFSTAPLRAFSASAPSWKVASVYVTFLVIAAAVYFTIAAQEFASIQTMACMSQCLAMVLLSVHVLDGKGTEGISIQSVVLHVLAFVCRLSSTTWLNGYLPVDATGDWFYQAVDVLSLGIAIGLLVFLVAAAPHGQPERVREALVAVPAFLTCFALGGLLHANMDKRPLFDALWMAGAFLASWAVVPQLRTISALPLQAKQKGAGDLPGHAIVTLGMSQVLSAIYIWHARKDIECDEMIEGFNHASWAIIAAHVLPVVMLCDFTQECLDVQE
jgi:hypothetical protein